MQESIVFLVRVQCHREESSRSLFHLLMSFLYNLSHAICYSYGTDNKQWLQLGFLFLLHHLNMMLVAFHEQQRLKVGI